MLKYYHLAAILLLPSLTPAHAGLIITDDIHYLQRAQLYPNVGWTERSDAEYGTAFNGSGVLIHPNWVLFSGHQALYNDFDLSTTYDSFRVGFGSNYLTNPGENQVASELFIHPTYGGPGQSGYDLAMLYFPTPFTSITSAEMFLFPVVQGMDSDIVGFGNLQVVNDPNVTFTGDRRAGNNVVASQGLSIPLEYARTFLEDQTSSKFRELGMAARNGDSGGGFLLMESSVELLVQEIIKQVLLELQLGTRDLITRGFRLQLTANLFQSQVHFCFLDLVALALDLFEKERLIGSSLEYHHLTPFGHEYTHIFPLYFP